MMGSKNFYKLLSEKSTKVKQSSIKYIKNIADRRLQY